MTDGGAGTSRDVHQIGHVATACDSSTRSGRRGAALARAAESGEAAPVPADRVGIAARLAALREGVRNRDPVVDVRSVTIDAEDGRRIPLRIYEGAGLAGPSPIIVWFHGGGFVMGDLYTAGATCRAIARRTGALVVAVQYRLVPEHSLAGQIDDCHTRRNGCRSMRRRSAATPHRSVSVAIPRAACWQRWLRSGVTSIDRPSVKAQILLYPATDLTRSYPRRPARDTMMPFTPMHAHWLRTKVGSASTLDDRRFSPLHSPRVEHAPPAILVTAGFDPLCREAFDYASRLADAGRPGAGHPLSRPVPRLRVLRPCPTAGQQTHSIASAPASRTQSSRLDDDHLDHVRVGLGDTERAEALVATTSSAMERARGGLSARCRPRPTSPRHQRIAEPKPSTINAPRWS